MCEAERVFECIGKAADISARKEQLARDLRGISVNTADEDGYTALMYAVLRDAPNRNSTVSLLLDLGADCDLENKNGETALFMAMERGQSYIVFQMLWLADKKFTSSNGNTSLAVARYFSPDMADIIPLMEAWGFIDTGVSTTYQQGMDLLYFSSGCSTCGGMECGKKHFDGIN